MFFRFEARNNDPEKIERLVRATGFFSDQEVDIAVELIQERLAKGDDSGYHFVFLDHGLDHGAELLGYACHGPTPGSPGGFDLYWIAVAPKAQGRGLGQKLMAEAEKQIKAAGGRRIFIETSSRDLYIPTRKFYEKQGYVVEGVIKDFYSPNDHKMICSKRLP